MKGEFFLLCYFYLEGLGSLRHGLRTRQQIPSLLSLLQEDFN
jgi:hypothetical protein